MKFTIEKSVIVKSIAHASRVIEKRNTIPILGNVMLVADGDTLTMKTTDLDLELTLTVPAVIEEGGGTTVSALLLNDIVRKLGSDTVSFATDGKGSMKVGAGRSKFELHCLPVEDMPDMTIGTFKSEFSLETSLLKRMIAKTQFAISTEETRYYLNGIFFHTAEKNGAPVLRTVATDGHRLALCDIPAPEGTHGMPGVIIPRKAVAEFDKLLDTGKEATVEVSDTKIRMRVGTSVIVSKLIDGTFPDYQRVIPEMSNQVAIANSKLISDAADRVSTVSSERGRAVKLTFGDNALMLEVNNPDSGSARDEIEIQYDADRVEVGFNNRYLQDILANISSNTVRISLLDAGSPAVLRDDDSDDSLFVLMPMRV